ncbi:MAG TPA: hypothetical protein VGW78_04365 [Candidatus Babeliales bacterium]|jgi:hypothetical protein|nr:hypothetical protein [Candidatus Babeliales bacterium]
MRNTYILFLIVYSFSLYGGELVPQSKGPIHFFANWQAEDSNATSLCNTLDIKDVHALLLTNKAFSKYIHDNRNQYIHRITKCLTNTLQYQSDEAENLTINSLLLGLGGNTFSVIVENNDPRSEKDFPYFLRHYKFTPSTFFERIERSPEDITNNKPIEYRWGQEYWDSITLISSKPIGIFIDQGTNTICVSSDKKVGVMHLVDRVYIYNARGEMCKIEFARRSMKTDPNYDYTKDPCVVKYDDENKSFILEDTGISIARKFLAPDMPWSYDEIPTLKLFLHGGEIWGKQPAKTSPIQNVWSSSSMLGSHICVASSAFPPKIRDILKKQEPSQILPKEATIQMTKSKNSLDSSPDKYTYTVGLRIAMLLYNSTSIPGWDNKATKPLKSFYQENVFQHSILDKLCGYKTNICEIPKQLIALYYAGFPTEHTHIKTIKGHLMKDIWWPLSNGKEINAFGSIRYKKTNISRWLRFLSFIVPGNNGVLKDALYEYEKNVNDIATSVQCDLPPALDTMSQQDTLPATDELENQIVQTVFDCASREAEKVGYTIKPLDTIIKQPLYKRIYNSFFDTIEMLAGKIICTLGERFLEGI